MYRDVDIWSKRSAADFARLHSPVLKKILRHVDAADARNSLSEVATEAATCIESQKLQKLWDCSPAGLPRFRFSDQRPSTNSSGTGHELIGDRTSNVELELDICGGPNSESLKRVEMYAYPSMNNGCTSLSWS